MTQTITLTARQFRALIEPVLPMACKDDMLPVLCAVQVTAEDRWLTATTTDRFRVGIKRIEKHATDDDATTEWPEFSALIPVRAVRSILATFKPTRGFDPAMALTVAEDRLVVEAAGAFDLFDSSRFVHHLQSGEYPKVRSLIREVLAVPDDERVSRVVVNPTLFADFKACGSSTLRILMGRANKPLVVTDDEGFIGVLMPRRRDSPEESWDDLLGVKSADEKKAEAAA